MERDETTTISRRGTLKGSLMVGVAAALPAVTAECAALGGLSAGIDAANTKDPISKYMFGCLAEHIGNWINYCVWSEVLDDRKFYYPVDSQPIPKIPGIEGRIIFNHNGNENKWRPIGPDDSVTMDSQNPYTGKHSPRVTLAGNQPRGIRQGGLSLRKNIGYSGRIVAAGDPGASVHVALIWGPGPGDRQSVTLPLGQDWASRPITFTCGADTTDGRMEITGTGTGTFRVGAASLMPDDNIQGFRKDTIALLKGLDSGFWRVPGGNFVSGYDWTKTVGDIDKRPPTWDYAWGAAQPNDVGLHELITLCRLIGVDPYLCVSTGFDSPRDGAALVEYCNGAASTPMGKARAANGHPEPFGIKWWNVGNEMYGCWQMGHMAVEHYVIKHNMFVEAMRAVDPNIVIIASGASPDEMTEGRTALSINPVTRTVAGNVQAQLGTESDWNGHLLEDCWGNFDIISEHCYASTERFDPKLQKRVPVDEPVVDSCRRAANRIRQKREYWEEYKQRFPALKDGKIKVSVDEWGFQNATGLKQALGIAMTLHEFFRCTDFITMAGYTMGMSWLNYNRTDSVYSHIGLLFNLYNKHFGRIPVEVTGNAPQPKPKFPPGGDVPHVNPGSPTYPLDVSAALSEDRKTLTVAVINATDAAHPLNLEIRDFQHGGQGQVWRYTGPSLDATNIVGKPQLVTVTPSSFDASAGSISVAPHSVEIYAFPAV
jgi:alpha-N-arabinofuranosidase